MQGSFLNPLYSMNQILSFVGEFFRKRKKTIKIIGQIFLQQTFSKTVDKRVKQKETR